MNDNKIMEQITAIFGIFMVLFYLGAGIFLIFFFDNTTLQKPVRVIMGSSFLFYGVYRAFVTYTKIAELFFKRNKKDD